MHRITAIQIFVSLKKCQKVILNMERTENTFLGLANFKKKHQKTLPGECWGNSANIDSNCLRHGSKQGLLVFTLSDAVCLRAFKILPLACESRVVPLAETKVICIRFALILQMLLGVK